MVNFIATYNGPGKTLQINRFNWSHVMAHTMRNMRHDAVSYFGANQRDLLCMTVREQ